MLYLYNSLTRKKEIFTPLIPDQIGLYTCGITVYDYCHLGHARSMVCFDVIVRFLRSQGFKVKFVRNITDIDDKIILRAQERGVSIQELTEYYIKAMHEDAAALNILTPDFEPRATDYMSPIISLIQRLMDKEYAYQSDNGDICFAVESFKGYGKLSHKDIEGLVAGARIGVVKEKRSPLDFVLWKKAKPNEPSWSSPWGEGRPGWHIECSAMAMDELGEQFDIHGGGLDLQFPHHENEIAQSEAASGKPFANYWLHVGMLQVNNEKMAKSTGNFFTIQDVLQHHHPEVIRYFLLSSHYRSPLNYSEENLHSAARALTRLYQSLKDINEASEEEVVADWLAAFNKAMNDDFNTPVALSILFQLSHEFNKSKTPALAATLKKLAGVLGLLQSSPKEFLQAQAAEVDKELIESLIEERQAARAAKNWQQADEIRATLLNYDIELEDGPDGTTWRKKLVS
ncbi:cysteinyl-tRNA synthetase [Legionella beliardensis]|uniref:Cysteine--tRNA ligase n=1 Tax=Legionella beliardensis TaxID=91822 RepID=A0A378I9J1_9GAMM|nr:cysteine--tRNA ligase [Legionella beliardensis]STX29054.1 cysteinyl-tRNA synthetase [Legionella beliardensis]